MEQWQQQSLPVGHEHGRPAHAKQAVGDEHALLIAQVHAGGHILMADDKHSPVGKRLRGCTPAHDSGLASVAGGQDRSCGWWAASASDRASRERHLGRKLRATVVLRMPELFSSR